MKDNKMLLFIVGLLLGAVIATGAFFVYSKTNKCDCTNSSSNSNSNNGMGQPPEMPSGQGNMGEPPAKPGESSSTNSNSGSSN